MYLYLIQITYKMTEQETVKSITYNGDELTSLQESLESYLGILTFNYMNWLIASTQGKQMLPSIEDDKKKLEVEEEIKKIKDDLVVLDMAIPKVKWLLIKLNEVLWIDKTYDTAEDILKRNNIEFDEAVTDEWTWEVQDDASDNKPEAEVSESA